MSHGPKPKIGPCAKCGTVGPLCKDLCYKCYSKKWHAEHRGKRKDRFCIQKGRPDWIEEWLKDQAKNYLRENANQFDRNATRFWVMTEEQIIGLCRIIYAAMSKHSSGRHEFPIDKHQKKAWWDQEDGDGHYLDRSVSPELRGLK